MGIDKRHKPLDSDEYVEKVPKKQRSKVERQEEGRLIEESLDFGEWEHYCEKMAEYDYLESIVVDGESEDD